MEDAIDRFQEQFIVRRSKHLRDFALRGAPSHAECSRRIGRVLKLEGQPFGRLGNMLITVANGLWLADHLNASLQLPAWAHIQLLKTSFFNLSIFYKSFCIRSPHAKTVVKFQLNLGAIELYNIDRLYNQEKTNIYLPDIFSKATFSSGVDIQLRFLASLWASPSRDILKTGVFFITTKLLRKKFNISDFSMDELPLAQAEWTLLRAYDTYPKNCPEPAPQNPLCEMDTRTVKDILSIHNFSRSSLFIATDMQSNITNLLTDFDGIVPEVTDYKNANPLFFDLFVMLHSDLFIQNPESTFSKTICMLRALLGLKTIPNVNPNKTHSLQESTRPEHWVSCAAVKRHLAEGGLVYRRELVMNRRLDTNDLLPSYVDNDTRESRASAVVMSIYGRYCSLILALASILFMILYWVKNFPRPRSLSCSAHSLVLPCDDDSDYNRADVSSQLYGLHISNINNLKI